MERTREEYGGFLPLEIKDGIEYHCYENMNRYNCGKAAINAIFKYNDFEKVYIPYYLCPNVCSEVESHRKQVCYYNIDKELMPIGLMDEDNICVYLVDYFGIMNTKIREYACTFKKATVIVDFCHSFFSKPIWKDNVYNVYSCKKFFGVPDGAYLIGNRVQNDEQYSYSADKARYLLDCVERGTNYCYQEKKEVDKKIAEEYAYMSILSLKMMQGIDYEYVKKRRILNFQMYDDAFGKINKIKIEKESIPYVYPLHCGKNMKKYLIDNKIYVSTLWGQMLDDKYKEYWEYELTDKTIFLPLDQRYNKEDIEYIIHIIKLYSEE